MKTNGVYFVEYTLIDGIWGGKISCLFLVLYLLLALEYLLLKFPWSEQL